MEAEIFLIDDRGMLKIILPPHHSTSITVGSNLMNLLSGSVVLGAGVAVKSWTVLLVPSSPDEDGCNSTPAAFCRARIHSRIDSASSTGRLGGHAVPRPRLQDRLPVVGKPRLHRREVGLVRLLKYWHRARGADIPVCRFCFFLGRGA